MSKEFETFKDKIFFLAKKYDSDVQISYSQNRDFQVRYQNGDMDQYTDAGKFKINVLVLKDGKLGSSYTETFEDPEKVFLDAYENISIVDGEDTEYFYDGSGKYLRLEPYDGSFENLPVKNRIGYVETAHSEIRKDERILSDMAVYGDQMNKLRIANTLGLDVSFINGGGFMYAMAIVKDKSPRSAAEFTLGRRPEDINAVFVGNKAREESIALIGSQSVKSGKYRIILRNDVFSDILGMLVSMISAENAHKNLSPLKDRLGEKIGSDVFTVKDLPFHPMSISNAPFDTQGVPTSEKAIIEKGIFRTFLHNLKTANKDGVKPTGNAMGNSIAPINLYVEPGTKSFDELLTALGDGILIIQVDGMHAGANPISGNFSLGAKGFKVENGKIVRGVEEITISGNFLEMMKDIEEIGSDLRAFIGLGGYVVPSVIVSEIDVAGTM